MKGISIFGLAALLLISLCACKPHSETVAQDGTPPVSNTTDATEKNDSTEAPTGQTMMPTGTGPVIPTGAVALTEQELKWFNTEFFASENTDGNPINIRNMFLRPVYEAPEMIDLKVVFYDGISRDMQMSQAEIDLFDSVTGKNAPLDNVKIPRADLERIFLENTGLTVEGSQKIGLDQMTYLEQYDAYYLEHGDSAYTLYMVESGYKMDDGTVVLYYADRLSSSTGQWQVTLHQQEETYWFVANKPVE